MDDSIPGKLDELRVQHQIMATRIDKIELQVGEILPVVLEIREAQIAKRWFAKRAGNVGSGAKFVAAIIGLITAIGGAIATVLHLHGPKQ